MLGAARVHDPIAHSFAAAGMLLGAVGGLLLGRSTVTTVIGAKVGRLVGGLISRGTGEIVTGSCNVLVDGQHLACAVLDQVRCSGLPLIPFSDHALQRIATGVPTVLVNHRPVATKDDKAQCGATITDGSTTVFVGGAHDIFMAIDSEVPAVFDAALFVVSLASGHPFLLGVLTLFDPDARRNVLRPLIGGITPSNMPLKILRDGVRVLLDTASEASTIDLLALPALLWDLLPKFDSPITSRASAFADSDAPGSTLDNPVKLFPSVEQQNAARHAYWMAELTAEYGPEIAREVGIGHELGDETGENSTDSMIDYYNNVVGRQIGDEVKSLPPEEREQVIRQRIIEMIKNGQLITDPAALALQARCG